MNTLLLVFLVGGANILAYGFIYPKLVQGHVKRLIISDLVLSLVLLTCVGATYSGTDTRFDFGLFSLNWFFATLLISFVFELFLFPWYQKRFNIQLPK
ncbi:hypothetical protein [Thiolinea disciformis]|uniref:hypothetical protein n=1 Tax=Thiolinea disciformis TaxID=125614 RepID=UPI0003604864|nr:hypothetical protein [Thiolinea disciformis]